MSHRRIGNPNPVLPLLCILSLVGVTNLPGQEKLSLLLDRSPAPANAIGYVNVPALNALMADAGFTHRVTENVDAFWFIADLDLDSVRPKWEAGYSSLKSRIDTEAFAKEIGGYVDSVEGTDVVFAPNETYFVPLEDNRMGMLRPANRKLLAGWLTPSIKVNYSDFLTANANQPESYLSFMVAIDLSHSVSPVPLAKKLEQLESLQANPPQTVAKILASMEGVSVIVGRRSLNECIVKFQFSRSPTSLKLIANKMLAEILEKNGVSAPEVLTWKLTADDTSLSLQGTITESTLSGLMSVFSMESQARSVVGGMSSASLARSAEEQTLYRTKSYFADVNRVVDQTRGHKSKTTGAMARWNDQRARQIDELGTLNVDPEMVQYGINVAELLRGNALTIREGNISAGQTKVNQGLQNNGYYGGYGDGYYYNTNSTADYQNATNAIAQGNSYRNYRETLNQIDKLTAQVRRDMTQKYQTQF
ncbi:MAG: hypothetical protein AAGD07_24245 [Planctomycetota bacterium]